MNNSPTIAKTKWTVGKLTLHKNLFKKDNVKKALWSFAITFACFGVFAENVHFIKSYTDSLPEHYFIQLPRVAPKKGDLTIMYNGWYQGRIIKRIIGEAGDQITSDQGNVWINGVKIGRAYQRTEFAKQSTNANDNNHHGASITLTPIKSQVIPHGQVFLYAPHPKSFDSRYEEVGLVKLSDLEGKIIAIG
jgi:conjugal transfer pilin signal peptidase TrbI